MSANLRPRLALNHLASETALFSELTGLAHISGVDDPIPAIGPRDRLVNFGQIAALFRDGYSGPPSFEPFAENLRALSDPASAVRASMDFMTNSLVARAA